MNKLIAVIITISSIFALMIASGLINDFDFGDYLKNLENAFTSFPEFPNFKIAWGDLSITNWEPLADFFGCIIDLLIYPFRLIGYFVKIVVALFGFDYSGLDVGDVYYPGTGGGGGHSTFR